MKKIQIQYLKPWDSYFRYYNREYKMLLIYVLSDEKTKDGSMLLAHQVGVCEDNRKFKPILCGFHDSFDPETEVDVVESITYTV